MSISNRIKFVRSQLNLSLRAFAEQLGYSQNAVHKWENGGNISGPALNLIAKTFNVNDEWLRTGEGLMFNDSLQWHNLLIADLNRREQKYKANKSEAQITLEQAGSTHSLGGRLYLVAKYLKINPKDFAAALDISLEDFEQLVDNPDKASTISRDNLAYIADKWNISPLWLDDGTPDAFINTEPQQETSIIAEQLGLVLIPRYDVKAAAGGGSIVSEEHLVDHLAFQTKWIKRLPYPLNTLQSITVEGDSMEPTYRDGDLILLTTSIGDTLPEGAYVIRDYNGVRLKRLRIDRDGTLHVTSDNKEFYPEEIYTKQECENGAVSIIGKVLWVGRTV